VPASAKAKVVARNVHIAVNALVTDEAYARRRRKRSHGSCSPGFPR